MKNKRIIIKPVISEKSFADTSKGLYTFIVDKKAKKHEIKNSINEIFGVDVTDVKTSRKTLIKSTYSRQGTRKKSTEIKKARVKLKKGQTIDIFESEDAS